MLITKGSLLIVDDESSIRISLSLLLTEIGYSVRTAEDGFSALAEMHQGGVPDILLSDLNMPEMSGFELLSVVRRRFPEIRTVAMSGSFSGNEVPSGVAADAFFQKGSSLGSLLKILEALPGMERRPYQPCRAAAPFWFHRHGSDSCGKAPVTITCPQCLRTSSLALDGFEGMTHEVHCVHCGNSIEYEIVEPSSQTMQQAFRHKARVANLAQNASKLSN
jgi:CheY-like chemotaxis protein/Zn ribbon nucleic-acid-binding protein